MEAKRKTSWELLGQIALSKSKTVELLRFLVGRAIALKRGGLSMRIVYDASVDVLDIYLSAGSSITSREIAPGVIADLDKDGNILSLEILDASDRYSKEDLAKLTFERVPA